MLAPAPSRPSLRAGPAVHGLTGPVLCSTRVTTQHLNSTIQSRSTLDPARPLRSGHNDNAWLCFYAALHNVESLLSKPGRRMSGPRRDRMAHKLQSLRPPLPCNIRRIGHSREHGNVGVGSTADVHDTANMAKPCPPRGPRCRDVLCRTGPSH